MKKNSLVLFLALISAGASRAQSIETFHDFAAVTIEGDTISLSDYYGKKVMVVNTATYCMYTPQYEDLENLYTNYSSYNFEIIGFPCNDFGGQEPGDDSTINDFCTGTYGITFQMMSKVYIVTPDTAEVYKWLQLESRNGVADAPVTWNFHKFLIDEAGHWVNHYPSQINPLNSAITDWIMSPSVLGNPELNNNFDVSLSQNPVKDELNLVVNSSKADELILQLFTIDGKGVGELQETIKAGGSISIMDVTYLPSGLYLLNCITGKEKRLLKVAIVK